MIKKKSTLLRRTFVFLMAVFALYIVNQVSWNRFDQCVMFRSPRYEVLSDLFAFALPVIGNILLFIDSSRRDSFLFLGRNITPHIFSVLMIPVSVICSIVLFFILVTGLLTIANDEDSFLFLGSAHYYRAPTDGYPIYIRESGDLDSNSIVIEQRRPILGNSQEIFWCKKLYLQEDADKVLITQLSNYRFECVFPPNGRRNRTDRVVLENR